MKSFLHTILVLTLFASSGSLWAQYGIGTNTPNESAALEIESPDKGVLIPSITLTGTATFAPITGTPSAVHNGMIVWNNSTSTLNGLSGPGFYFWDGGSTGNWFRLITNADAQSGTIINSTLRWDGDAWVETDTFLNSGTGTATLAADTTLIGTLAISGNTTVTGALVVENNATVTGTLEVTGNTTLTGDAFVEGNTTARGSLTAQSTTTLEAALVDSYGNTGVEGEVLSSTGTSTQWINPNNGNVQTMSTTGSVNPTTSLLMLTPSADMNVTLVDAASLPVGFEIKIRRNQGYTGTNDHVVLQGNGGQTIDGTATKQLDVGYQSLTLVNLGTSWVSVR